MSGQQEQATAPPRPAPLRILYVQPGTSTFAGIERVVDTIGSKLAEAYPEEFRVDVLYTTLHRNFPAEPRSYTVVRRLASTRLGLLAAIRRTVRDGDYDLLVVPQIEPTVICWIACLGLRPRLVMHLHGNPQRENHHVKAQIMFSLMRALVLRHVSYVFGTSPKQLATFRTMFRSAVPQIWTPNPVRTFADDARRRDGPAEVVTFVNVGRFCLQKGQDLLLKAFAELYSRRSCARLKLVGHGDDEASLRAQADALGLGSVVTFEHYPDSPEIPLSSSDVYVSTSRWEGWSLAICEGLRFGLPVVSTDCDFGPSDILVDRRLGRLVDPARPDDLVAAMTYYCDNMIEERRHAHFRQRHIDRYSVDKVVHEHARALRLAALATSAGGSGQVPT